jgi:DNA invertase Pin-like site-specific DNA recombinase
VRREDVAAVSGWGAPQLDTSAGLSRRSGLTSPKKIRSPPSVDPDTLAVAIDRRKRGESVTAIAKHLKIGRSTLYCALEPYQAEAPAP